MELLSVSGPANGSCLVITLFTLDQNGEGAALFTPVPSKLCHPFIEAVYLPTQPNPSITSRSSISYSNPRSDMVDFP